MKTLSTYSQNFIKPFLCLFFMGLSSCALNGAISPLNAESDGSTSPSQKACATASSYKECGSGTASDPFKISNAAQLAGLMNDSALNDWSASYKLTANIDMSYYDGSSASKTLRSIGYYDTSLGSHVATFSGSFDGAGYAISNLKMVAPANQSVGLFGSTLNAQISNLILSNINISGGQYSAGLVGYGRNTVISDIQVSGTLTATGNSSGGVIGRLDTTSGTSSITSTQSSVSFSAYDASGNFAGYLNTTSGGTLTIQNVSSSGSVTQSVANGNTVGGLIGYVNTTSGGTTSIQNSFTTSSVTLPTGGSWTGGFAGQINTSGAGSSVTVSKCYSTASISVPMWASNRWAVGGFVGNLSCGTSANCQIQKSYYSGTATLIAAGYGTSGFGGFVGSGGASSSATLSLSDIYVAGTLQSSATPADKAGGMFGLLTVNSATANISRVYSSMTMAGTYSTDKGSLLGGASVVSGGTINWTSSYWDSTATASGSSVIIGGISGLTSAQMNNSANFTGGWDFTNVWISDGISPPKLR